MAVSPEGHIYVGNQDTSIKLYKAPADGSSSRSSSRSSSATNGLAGARLIKEDSRSSVINSMNGRRGSLYATAADMAPELLLDSDDVTYDQVKVADCTTQPSNGHVGCVNALVLCGKYVCSAGGDAMVRGESRRVCTHCCGSHAAPAFMYHTVLHSEDAICCTQCCTQRHSWPCSGWRLLPFL
jgi:hypothetical protein